MDGVLIVIEREKYNKKASSVKRVYISLYLCQQGIEKTNLEREKEGKATEGNGA